MGSEADGGNALTSGCGFLANCQHDNEGRRDRMSLDGLLYNDADGDGTNDGEIDDFEKLLRTLANDVYTAINEQGHI